MYNKLKFLLLSCGIFCGLTLFSQGSDCATAIPALIGVNTADGPADGAGAVNLCGTGAVNADWYTYTAGTNASVTLESCLGGVDTRVNVYTGTCAGLTCLTENDDFCELAPGLDPFASSVTFAAAGGTTYYIEWDDRWEATGFDWTLSETPLDCPVLGLNIGDPCDLAATGDGVVSDLCACVALAAPDCATLLVPADGAIEVPIDPTNDGVGISWAFNGFQPTDGTNIYWGTDPAALTLLGAAGAGGVGVTITGVTPGTYFWQAVPFNAAGEAVGCDIFELTTTGCEETAGPDCPAALVSPADAAVGVVLTGDNLDAVNLSWTNAATGAIRDFNGVYFGTDPSALPLLGNAVGDSTNVDVTGVQMGITYYWSIVPSNCFGEAIGPCEVFSFTVDGTVDCPAIGLNGLNIGFACDDGDANTLFDVVQDGCVCAGIPIPGNATCDGAIPVSEGTFTANQIIGGGGAADGCFGDALAIDALWYSYMAVCDGDFTISTAFDLDSADTRLSVYTGTCDALTCVDFNDDISADFFGSELTIAGVAGTTYLIEWDDRWGGAEFDFEITTPGPSCIGDFNNSGLVDGEDFSIFLGNFGIPCADTCNCPTDFNNDGDTDGDDFSVFLGNFGLSCDAGGVGPQE